MSGINFDLEDEEYDEPEEGPGRLKRFLKSLKWAPLVLLGVVSIAYLVVSNSAFVRGVIVPNIETAIEADISLTSVKLSPLSRLIVKDLVIAPKDGEALMSADHALVRYSLWSFLAGHVNLKEIVLERPQITIIETPDGRSNLDDFLDGLPDSDDSDEPLPKISIHNASIQEGQIRIETDDGNDEVSLVVIDLDHVGLERIVEGETGRLKLDAGVAVSRSSNAAAEGQLAATLKGGYDVEMGRDLIPNVVNGSIELRVDEASGDYHELEALEGALDLDLTPKMLEQASLSFQQSGEAQGRIGISGPLALSRMEGRLTVAFENVGRHVLNLVTTVSGIGFGDTSINGSTSVDLSRKGAEVSAFGNIEALGVEISQGEGPSPITDLRLEYSFILDSDDQSLLVRKAELSGESGGVAWLSGALDKPVNIVWSNQQPGFKEPVFQLAITNLNLGEWRPFLGESIPQGTLWANLDLTFQKDGQNIKADLTSGIMNLTAEIGTNQISGALANFNLAAQLEQFNRLSVNRYELDLKQGDTEIATGYGSASVFPEEGNMSFQVTGEGDVKALAGLLKISEFVCEKGKVELSSRYQKKGAVEKLTSNLGLTDFTGTIGSFNFSNYEVQARCEFDHEEDRLRIHGTGLEFRRSYESGGSFDIQGYYDTTSKTSDLTFQSVGLNQNALEPLLAPFVGNSDLSQISLNIDGSTKLDPSSTNQLGITISLKDLVPVSSGAQSSEPLKVELDLTAAWDREAVEIGSTALRLSPTDRAENEIRIEGRLALAPTEPTPSSLSIKSFSVDLTPYADLLATNESTESPETEAGPAPNPADPSSPADPVDLPIDEFGFELNLRRLYLRELALTNWVAQATVKSNVIDLSSTELNLNGAPVQGSARLDVGVPGYQYGFRLTADEVPIAPIHSSFKPEKAGQVKGTLTANATLNGAGLLDPDLQKNLTGDISVLYTNANIQTVGPRLKLIMTPVVMLLRLPELTESPIDWMDAQLVFGDGKAKIPRLDIAGPAMMVHTEGEIPFAPVLTNSPLSLPIDVLLERGIAKRANLLASNTPTNAVYAKLPDFARLEGTLGAYKTVLNKTVISQLLLKSAAGLPFDYGKKGFRVINTLGGLLGSDKEGEGDPKDGDSVEAADDKSEGIVGGIFDAGASLINSFRGKDSSEEPKEPD